MIMGAPYCGPVILASDFDLVQVALNLEFLEAEFFLIGANGEGLDTIAPNLAQGGPPPIGARKANLDDTARRIIQEFGFEEVGHIRFLLLLSCVYIYIYIYIPFYRHLHIFIQVLLYIL